MQISPERKRRQYDESLLVNELDAVSFILLKYSALCILKEEFMYS